MLDRLLGKKNKALLGVDIGCSSVKLLQLSRAGNRYRVESYASRPLPENSVVEKNITSIEGVGETIYKAATVTKTSGASAAVAVSGSAVITKTIEMNASLNDTDMENQIIVEADQYIPYPLDEVAIDFERIGESPKNPDMVEVLLAACKKENVDLRVSALEIGGLTAKVVDIEAYAMERAYHLLREQTGLEEHKVVAIFDIGATISTLYIIVNGRSIYTREQIFGGAQLSAQVQASYGLDVAEAEAAIREGGLPENYEAEMLYPFKEEVTEQISRSLQFFFSSSQYNDVDLVILAGGVAASRGLAEMVQEGLSTQAIVANPFARMSVGSKVSKAALAMDAPSLMLACGLAMRGLDT